MKPKNCQFLAMKLHTTLHKRRPANWESRRFQEPFSLDYHANW